MPQHLQEVPDHLAEQPPADLVAQPAGRVEGALPVSEDLEVAVADGPGDRPGPPLAVVHAGARQGADPLSGEQHRIAERDVLVPAGLERERQPDQQLPPDDLVPGDVQDAQHPRPLRDREDRRRGGQGGVGRTGLDRAVPVHPVETHQQHVGVGLLDPGGHRGEHPGGQPVVTVDEPDVLPGGVLETEVAGPAETEVGRRGHHPDPGVAGGVLGQDRGAVVRRAVVHRDDLEVGERLAQYRVQALAQVTLHPVHRQHHTEQLHRARRQSETAVTRNEPPT